MMNTNRTLKLTTLALCGVINILGGTIALLLRLPVYLDSIGTVLAAALFGSACDFASRYCGKFHNHCGCFRWNYFLRLHCAGAAASQPRHESDAVRLRCTGSDRLCGPNDRPCCRSCDSACCPFCFRQSFHEKQKIICTNSTKNPAKNSLSFLQDSHILA